MPRPWRPWSASCATCSTATSAPRIAASRHCWRSIASAPSTSSFSGRGPTGLFSEIDQERHLAILQRWHEHLGALGGAGERFEIYSFGRAREHAEAGELLPPLALTVNLGEQGASRPVRVELFGRTEPVGGPEIGSLVLSHRPTEHPRHLIRGFLDQLALSASGLVPGHIVEHAHVTTVITAGDHVAQYSLAPWTADEARAYLTALVTDMLGRTHEYLLPCEAVFAYRDKPERPIASVIDSFKSRGAGMSCLYGPVSQIDHLDAPADADAVIERRFGPLFQRLTSIERPPAAAGAKAGK